MGGTMVGGMADGKAPLSADVKGCGVELVSEPGPGAAMALPVVP